MVKTIASLAVSFALLAGAALFEHLYIGAKFERFESALVQLDSKAEEGSATRADAESVEALWEDEKTKLHAMIVSRGSATRTLPAFDGISFATLQEALTADGFSPVRVDEPSDDIEVGYVIRYQDHNAGDSLDYGSTVTVVVSTGPASGDAGTGDTAPAQ